MSTSPALFTYSSPITFNQPSPAPQWPLSERSYNTPSRPRQIHKHTPLKSSPLSHQPHSLFSMPEQSPHTPHPSATTASNGRTTPNSRHSSPAATPFTPTPRSTSNPLTQSREVKRQAQRQQFLQNIKNKRDAERFDERGDRLLHLDHLRERRRWEQRLREAAPPDPSIEPSEDEDREMDTSTEDVPRGARKWTDAELWAEALEPGRWDDMDSDEGEGGPSVSVGEILARANEIRMEGEVGNKALEDVLARERGELEYLVGVHEGRGNGNERRNGDGDADMHDNASDEEYGSEFESELWALATGMDDAGAGAPTRNHGAASDVMDMS